MTDAAAALLALTLTLLPGANVERARDIAREALTRAGCADVRVGIRGAAREPVQVDATCRRLGPPSPGTPEGAWRGGP